MSHDNFYSLVSMFAEPECMVMMTSDDVDRAALLCKKVDILKVLSRVS